MPYKPRRACSHPGCPELTDSQYYGKHKKQEDSAYNKYHRNPAHRIYYGGAWRRIRKKYIEQHPICEECEKEGRLVPATEVHHRVFLENGGTHAKENLQSLCAAHHNKIHHSWNK